MKTGATKPEWDTPPNGDFASYVERLTASPPPETTASRTARARAAAAPASAAPREAATGATSLPPELAIAMLPVLGVLRAVRAVLLALTLLHAGLLFVVGRGSLPGLLVMAAVWWGLGRLLQLAPDPRARARGGSTAAAKARTEQALQERLHQVAQTRNPGKKKQP